MIDLEKKIRELARSNDMSIKSLATSIDMTEGGFYDMLKRDSIKVRTLEKISSLFNVHPSYFLTETIPEPLVANEPETLYQTHKFHILPGFEDCNIFIKMTGDSMETTFSNGDLIICKHVDKDNPIRWGEPYFIQAKESFVKRIEKHSDPEKLICTSDNMDYDDIILEIKDIQTLFWIKGYVSSATGKHQAR